jgi:hypothetical protein
MHELCKKKKKNFWQQATLQKTVFFFFVQGQPCKEKVREKNSKPKCKLNDA